jgi:hypothetical protein
MTKHTARDEVWNHALRYALLEESFNIQRIRSDMTTRASSQTIRDTLNTMSAYGWLDKESSQAHTWYPGPKANDIENCDQGSHSSTPDQSDRNVYSAVDRVSERYSDRVSNSANLVIEGVGGSHALGSHGPLEEYVRIPYKDGDPIQVALPRSRYESRVLVCREQDIVREGDRVKMLKQPKLQLGDIVPVRLPLVVESDGSEKEIKAKDLDGIPLPLFANVDTLRPSNGLEFDSDHRYAVKIDSISDGVAVGIEYDQSEWGGRSGTESLDAIAESIGTIIDSTNANPTGRLATGWDDRKENFLTDIANTYD